MERLRAASDMLRIAANAHGSAIGYAPWTRTTHLLDDVDWGILQQAVAPATLDEHVRRLESHAVLRDRNVRQRVERLERAGLLVRVHEFECVAPTPSQPVPLHRVVIPTRDRPDALRACIESWASVARRHDRPLEVVVADDGREELQRRATRGVLETLASDGIDIAYAGPDERLRYAELLAQHASIDVALVRWALHFAPPEISGEGSVRNALLLDSVGRGMLFVDDDTRAVWARPPTHREGLTITDRNPQQAWFPDHGGVGLDLVSAVDVDPRAVAETVLGRDVHAWTRDVDTTFDAAPSLLCRNLRDHGGRVAAVQCGIVGDVATGSLAHYLTLSGAARQRLHRSQRVYEHALASRQAVVSATGWSIADVDHCMTYFLALDTRRMLPPFMPMGRNCDGLFGVLLRRAYRDAYTAFAPWALEHAAAPRPSSRQHMVDTAAQIYGNDLLLRLVAGAALTPAGDDPRRDLAAAGHVLTQASTCDDDAWVEHVWAHVVRTRAQDRVALGRTLQAFRGQPAYWAADVRAVSDNLLHLLAQPALAHPHDLTRVHGAAKALEVLRRRAQNYGRLLLSWPSLWEAARELSGRGVRVATPVSA